MSESNWLFFGLEFCEASFVDCIPLVSPILSGATNPLCYLESSSKPKQHDSPIRLERQNTIRRSYYLISATIGP